MRQNYQMIENITIFVENPEDKQMCAAADFLGEEILLRSGKKAAVVPADSAGNAVMTVATASVAAVSDGEGEGNFAVNLKRTESLKPEAFRLSRTENSVQIAAGDQRGFYYGVSRLLRKMYLKEQRIGIAESLKDCLVEPSSQMRGHQLGYRDKQNTCPAWTEEEYERYIRDLMIFGSNSIEILPPITDDCLYSCHFKRDPFDMMVNLSRIIHSYGLEVHMWYPYLSATIEEADFQKEMQQRERDFKAVPYLDGLLIPAGDPGELAPKEMTVASEATVRILHRYHPNAKVWIAPQTFSPMENWSDDFYGEVAKEPDWLYGVCFGPWERETIQEMYEKLPAKYKGTIRNYPDITHNMGCQFEVPDWDEAFSYTLGRESYNARPREFQKIHAYHKDYVMGSITYSEGIHDDLVKIIWGNLDYQDGEDVEETIRDYVRLFIDPDLEDELTEIILKLEDNWKGKILENENIDLLYKKIMQIHQDASAKLKRNYRYQLLLLRIVGDYQTKIRYAYDQELEKEAYHVLSCTDKKAAQRIAEARAILRKTYTEPVGKKERFLLQRLGDELYESCKIQLTTTRHRGQGMVRGAWLDSLDMALNDSQWMNAWFDRILQIEDEEQQSRMLDEMIHRCDPGPGGQYVHLGSFEGFQKVIKPHTWDEDPGFLRTPLMFHSYGLILKMYKDIGWYDEVPISVKWLHGARTIYGTPLEVKLDQLDPQKQYSLKVTYQNILLKKHLNMKLYAGDVLIHTEVDRKYGDNEPWDPCYSFDLPREAYSDGTLTLRWETYQPLGSCTVNEVWVIPKEV